jgi:hypothetical protein
MMFYLPDFYPKNLLQQKEQQWTLEMNVQF